MLRDELLNAAAVARCTKLRLRWVGRVVGAGARHARAEARGGRVVSNTLTVGIDERCAVRHDERVKCASHGETFAPLVAAIVLRARL